MSPVPIIAVILMLFTPRARTNGPAFLAGWILGLAIVGVIVLLVADTGDASTDQDTSDVIDVIKLLLGVLLLFLAYRQWQGRPREGQDAPCPPG